MKNPKENEMEQALKVFYKILPFAIFLIIWLITWGITASRLNKRGPGWQKVTRWIFLSALILPLMVALFSFKIWLGIIVLIFGSIASSLSYPFCFWLFEEIQEGHGIAVRRNKAFQRIVICWKNHKMDEDGNIIEITTQEQAQAQQNEKDELWAIILVILRGWIKGTIKPGDRIIGGLFRIGHFFDEVYEGEHTWYSLKRNAEGEIEINYHEKEKIRQYDLRPRQYPLPVKEAEDQNRTALDLIVTFMAQVTNLIKALFGIKDYIQTMNSFMSVIVTDEVNAEIAFIDKSIAKQDFLNFIFTEQIKEIKTNQGLYGFNILTTKIEQIGPNRPEDKAKLSAITQEKLTALANTAKEEQAVIMAGFTSQKEIILAKAKSITEFYDRGGAVSSSIALTSGIEPEKLPEFMVELVALQNKAAENNIDPDPEMLKLADETLKQKIRTDLGMSTIILRYKMQTLEKIQATVPEFVQKIQHDVEMADKGALIEFRTDRKPNNSSNSDSSGSNGIKLIDGADLERAIVLIKKLGGINLGNENKKEPEKPNDTGGKDTQQGGKPVEKEEEMTAKEAWEKSMETGKFVNRKNKKTI